MPQAFLEIDEDRLLIARLDIDHAVGQEPGLREGRSEQILPGETPEHLATQPRSNSRRKECQSALNFDPWSARNSDPCVR